MSHLRLFAIGFFAVTLQVTLFPALRIWGIGPDVVLIFVVAVAYRRGSDAGALFGFGAGLSLDLMVETPVGLWALTAALVGYGVGIIEGGVLRSVPGVTAIMGGIGGIAGGVIFVIAGSLVGQTYLLEWRIAPVIVGAALYDALLAPLAFGLVRFSITDPAQSRV